MIIEGSFPILEVAPFITSISRAAQGVMAAQLTFGSGGTNAYCTAWLLTDTLAVLPYSVFSFNENRLALVRCQPSMPLSDAIETDILATPTPIADIKTEFMPVLLRLHTPLPNCALSLAFKSVSVHDNVYLLHHSANPKSLQFSFGAVLNVDKRWLRYDANTLGGASGAPVLNASWEFAGMHVLGGRAVSPDANYNEAISISAILDVLRTTPEWGEIAEFHKLADVTAARIGLEQASQRDVAPRLDSVLLRAAVLWNFAPDSFPPELRDVLRTMVIDPEDEQVWILRPDERQRLLKSAGSLEALRKARGDEPSDEEDQQVIDTILRGPPYKLEDIDVDALPYWLQAIRWFAGVAPSLPTAIEVNRLLEQRRVRSRLHEITGPKFQGRTRQLATLHKWYESKQSGPMVISGIGGIGKSALVARFALELPEETAIFWLDFDRADIASDDAASMLRLLCAQAEVQIAGFSAPTFEPAAWESAAAAFAGTLTSAIPGNAPALLVLDSFEVAQYLEKYQEVWSLLEVLLAQKSNLRVLISGRSPVANLTLAGRTAASLVLTGLSSAHSEAWLREAGITDEALLSRLVKITRGIPLVLKLAVRWVEAGGTLQELTEDFSKAVVAGFLYRRILDRVIDSALKPVARGALVLRRLTAQIIAEVLGDAIPPALDAKEVFARLGRELALVSPGDSAQGAALLLAEDGVLRLRPEVRTATLRLLEQDDADYVRLINERAAAWYAKQDSNEITNAAELVYHRLRLNDFAGAEAAWRDECAPLLSLALDDFPTSARKARAWLRDHLREEQGSTTSLIAWEKDAVERIQSALRRVLLRAVPGILAERVERSDESPLIFYDAWVRWQDGDLEGARKLLRAAGRADGVIGTQRAVLAALLAARANDRAEADRLLAQLADEKREDEWDVDTPFSLAVQAARVHLATDLAAELDFAELLTSSDGAAQLAEVDHILPLSDLVLPIDLLYQTLTQAVETKYGTNEVNIPDEDEELPAFAHQLDVIRRGTLLSPVSFFLPLVVGDSDNSTDTFPAATLWQVRDLDLESAPGNQFKDRLTPALSRALDLAIMGWRRWRVAATTLCLAKTCQFAQSGHSDDLLMLVNLGALALFQGYGDYSFTLAYEGRSLKNILDDALRSRLRSLEFTPTADRLALAKRVLRYLTFGLPVSKMQPKFFDFLESTLKPENTSQRVTIPNDLFYSIEQREIRILCLYLFGPTPLETLTLRLLGLPPTFIL